MLSITMVYCDGPLLVCNHMMYMANDLASPLVCSNKICNYQNMKLELYKFDVILTVLHR